MQVYENGQLQQTGEKVPVVRKIVLNFVSLFLHIVTRSVPVRRTAVFSDLLCV